MKGKRLLCLALCVLLCAGCSGCGRFGFKQDGSFTCVLPGRVATLDPQTASGVSANTVIYSIFEGLCRIGEDGKVIPGAAKSWEENKTSTSFTFHLRRGAKWSNETPVTADDFLFAIQRALRPETAAPAVEDLFIIRGAREVYTGLAEESALGVRVENERTITFELNGSYPDFPALTAGICYMPCSREYFEQSAGHYGLSSEYLITNGPFTFSSPYSWRTDYGERAIYLTRSNDYRGEKKVLAKELSFLIDYDDAIDTDPVTAVAKGTVDILSLPEAAAKEAEKLGCGVDALDDAVTGLLLNLQEEKLELPVMRQLLFRSLDREDLLDRRNRDSSEEASGIMPACVRWDGRPYYGDGETLFEAEDPEVVQVIPSLLDMMRWDSVPSITVLCPDDEESINVANGILISWNNRLGTAFNIQPLPESEFRSRVANGDYEAALYTLRAGGTSPYSVLRSFESASFPSLLQDERYDEALHALDFELGSFRALEEQLQELCVFYPLFRDKTYYVTSPDARGISATPDLGLSFISALKKNR